MRISHYELRQPITSDVLHFKYVLQSFCMKILLFGQCIGAQVQTIITKI